MKTHGQSSLKIGEIIRTYLNIKILMEHECGMEDRLMFAKANVLGVNLPEEDIDSVLDLNNQTVIVTFLREWLSSFFSVEQSELCKTYLKRYSEAHNAMSKISFGSFEDDIHTKVIQSLASAKKCYAYAEYLACIELCALHGEMLVNYLCTANRNTLESLINKLTDDDQEYINELKSDGAFFADKIKQTVRVRWLLASNVINLDDGKALIKVHGMRINYFHRWRSKSKNSKNDALDALATLSPVSAKYLELYDRQDNIALIKRYMSVANG